MDKIIEVKNLWKDFSVGNEKIDILKNISLDIEKGEFVSIMGPSGCGKSTLLYLMGGLDTPSKGEVLLNGININKLNDKQMSKLRRKELGFVFQFYNLVQNLSVEDNIMLPILLDGENMKDYKKDLNEILEIIELSHKRKARALINKPEIILADEPIGNLDSKTGEEIMKLFQRINKERGMSIVNVTHSKESAEYGTHIVNLKDGVILEKALI